MMFTGPRRDKASTMCRGPHRRNARGVGSPKQVGSQERVRPCGQVPILGVTVKYISKRCD